MKLVTPFSEFTPYWNSSIFPPVRSPLRHPDPNLQHAAGHGHVQLRAVRQGHLVFMEPRSLANLGPKISRQKRSKLTEDGPQIFGISWIWGQNSVRTAAYVW